MGQVTLDVVIERPLDEVFAFVADLTHDPQWFRGVLSSRLVSAVQEGPGAEYEQVTRLFGWPFVARVRVTEYDPPRRMALVTRRSATPFTAVYTFEPVAGGTRYTLDATVVGAGFYRLFGPTFLPLLRRATRSRMLDLKRLLESGAGGPGRDRSRPV
jgi:uncharacterized protein YndB with AHSA1/START domain